MSAFENVDVKNTSDEVEYIEIEKVKYKVNYHYDGSVAFMDIIKNALKRDAETTLRQLENN
ncbi:MAG: hypothetical protein FWG45_06755 [Oscillospiraceae bacterium]|nr:hypothetical protein [Oscillospiraceae bacterium]